MAGAAQLEMPTPDGFDWIAPSAMRIRMTNSGFRDTPFECQNIAEMADCIFSSVVAVARFLKPEANFIIIVTRHA